MKKYFTDPKRLRNVVLVSLGQMLPDRQFIMLKWRLSRGYKLNLDNPKTFNEKLQWLKLNYRKPEYTVMVDKFQAKQYVSNIIGEEYIIPTLGVWDRFNDIDFDKLPNQFVLKCTHDSGGLVICKDKSKLDLSAARKKINRSLKRDYYLAGREWPYKDVPRKIIAEKYMEDESGRDLRDYKFYCFNGEPKYCQVISDRRSNETVDFFDMDWNHQEFTGLGVPHKPFSNMPVPIPVNFEKMKGFARELSKGISFLRVDLYEVNKKIYFGELTFFPDSGFGTFSPDNWNYVLGDMIDLTSFRTKIVNNENNNSR